MFQPVVDTFAPLALGTLIFAQSLTFGPVSVPARDLFFVVTCHGMIFYFVEIEVFAAGVALLRIYRSLDGHIAVGSGMSGSSTRNHSSNITETTCTEDQQCRVACVEHFTPDQRRVLRRVFRIRLLRLVLDSVQSSRVFVKVVVCFRILELVGFRVFALLGQYTILEWPALSQFIVETLTVRPFGALLFAIILARACTPVRAEYSKPVVLCQNALLVFGKAAATYIMAVRVRAGVAPVGRVLCYFVMISATC